MVCGCAGDAVARAVGWRVGVPPTPGYCGARGPVEVRACSSAPPGRGAVPRCAERLSRKRRCLCSAWPPGARPPAAASSSPAAAPVLPRVPGQTRLSSLPAAPRPFSLVRSQRTARRAIFLRGTAMRAGGCLQSR